MYKGLFVCHKNLEVNDGRELFKKGFEYEGVEDNKGDMYVIKDDFGNNMFFTKKKDREGVSYKKWFKKKGKFLGGECFG